MSFSLILRVVAAVLFILAAFGIPIPPRFNLIAAGLFCWVVSTLVAGA